MADTRLIEREAENQVDEESIEDDNTEMIAEFNINHSDSNSTEVKYKNLDGDWKSLCSLKRLIEKDISDILARFNLTSSVKIQNELSNLQTKLRKSWSKKYEMYKLSYRENNDNSSELYIPLETQYTNDIIVQQIYTNNDEFVAENVENSIEFPLYELESKDLFIKEITTENQTVYKLKERGFDEYINDYMDYNNKLKAQEGVIYTTTATIGLYSLYYAVWNVYSIEHAMILFGLSLLLYGIPILILLASIFSILAYVLAYIQSSRSSSMKTVRSFDTMK